VELLCLVDFSALDFIYRRSGEGLRQGSVRRHSGDDLRLGCVFRRSVVPLKRSSEEVLRRRSGDHLAILDPTGYLDIWADLDGVTQGDAAAFDSGISLTTLGLVSPTGPGCLVGFILGRHTTLGSFLHTYIVLSSGGGIVGVADSSLRSSVMYAMRWSSHCSMSAVSKWPKATAASYAVFDFGNAFKNSVSTPAGRGLGQESLTWPFFLHFDVLFSRAPPFSVEEGVNSVSGPVRVAAPSAPPVFVCMTFCIIFPGPSISAIVGLCIVFKWCDSSFWSGKLL
jgi:hypothetical protein